MKKILFWGDTPVIATGFANVLRSIIKYLPENKYDIEILGINQFEDIPEAKYKIYPAYVSKENYIGLDKVKQLIANNQYDLIFMLNDAWAIDLMTKAVRETEYAGKLVAYVPIDAEDHDPEWYHSFNSIDAVVAYNTFGKTVIEKANPQLNCEVISHGVDQTLFYKKYDTRHDAKKDLFPDYPELWDSFIFLNAGRNQPRKRLDITLRAFKKFAKDKRNVYLYMHTAPRDLHIDLIRMCNQLEIFDKIILTSKDHDSIQHVSFEDLNKIYNACDVGINTSIGEGFGLPNAEHASTGAPQIVPNHSALKELYKGIGVMVPANVEYTQENISTTGRIVLVEDCASAMAKIYKDKALYNNLSKKSIEKFTNSEFSWQEISKKWDELFTKLLNENKL